MNPKTALTEALLAALRGVAGLRPETPPIVPAGWVPWDVDALAIDIDEDFVEVRVVATRLPLPALLRRAETTLRSAMQSTGWAKAPLRLVVTDIDQVALGLC